MEPTLHHRTMGPLQHPARACMHVHAWAHCMSLSLAGDGAHVDATPAARPPPHSLPPHSPRAAWLEASGTTSEARMQWL